MSVTPLGQIISERIRKKGKISFAQFMEMALYYPELGYYNSAKLTIGRQGDFYTSPHVHSIFGQMLAEQLLEMAHLLPADPFVVVEFGAGKGFLAYDILKYLSENAPELASYMKYFIIETSQHLAAEQRKLLNQLSLLPNSVQWVENLDQIHGGQGFCGCIFSNELVDAFPVHRVRQVGGRLKEIYVTVDEQGRFLEILGPPFTPKLEQYLQELEIKLEEGQIAEINLVMLDWLEQIAGKLLQGFLITIDYGFPARELYGPQRTTGTLMCYHRHQAHQNPYTLIGEQDITAHVDFSALVKYGEKVGLEFTGFTTQSRFLINLGILEKLEEIRQTLDNFQEAYKMGLAVKKLIMPEGLGNVFKVLIQHKGISKPKLKGLKRGTFSPF
ncbi:class I SAM-dependent methyltransferase [Calderihabitans maritimus]|uniref:SAM-dependent methyltransferase n=1 Tax=Calderihabitans maritimus TaxID=1246530 RepID=A0A1Z5HNV9_9FIRM|nr:SAM-dependent methyltransferase [Calderihabitans maritimus]GAW91216.1 hypothetical protein GM21_1418 [Calderihabitans maritimus]